MRGGGGDEAAGWVIRFRIGTHDGQGGFSVKGQSEERNAMSELDVVVHGRQFHVPPAQRDMLIERLSKAERFGVSLLSIDAEVTEEHNPRLAEQRFIVQVTCRGTGPVVRVEAKAADVQTAVDLALARLEERLRRIGERRSEHRPRGGVLPVPAGLVADGDGPAARVNGAVDRWAPSDDDVVYEDGPVLVREKSHRAEPMTVPQALDALEAVGHDFFLFADAESGLPSVVYRRRGYTYGVIRLTS